MVFPEPEKKKKPPLECPKWEISKDFVGGGGRSPRASLHAAQLSSRFQLFAQDRREGKLLLQLALQSCLRRASAEAARHGQGRQPKPNSAREHQGCYPAGSHLEGENTAVTLGCRQELCPQPGSRSCHSCFGAVAVGFWSLARGFSKARAERVPEGLYHTVHSPLAGPPFVSTSLHVVSDFCDAGRLGEFSGFFS